MADRHVIGMRFEKIVSRRYMKCQWTSDCNKDRAWLAVIRARSTLCEDHLHKLMCEVMCSWRTAV